MGQDAFDFEEHRRGAARRSDPQTSKDAAKSVDAESVEGKFLACIRHHGPLTAEEVTNITGIPIDSTTPRTAPLQRLGLLVDSGERRPGASGKNRIVWRLPNVGEVVSQSKPKRRTDGREAKKEAERYPD